MRIVKKHIIQQHKYKCKVQAFNNPNPTCYMNSLSEYLFYLNFRISYQMIRVSQMINQMMIQYMSIHLARTFKRLGRGGNPPLSAIDFYLFLTLRAIFQNAVFFFTDQVYSNKDMHNNFGFYSLQEKSEVVITFPHHFHQVQSNVKYEAKHVFLL